MTYKFRAWDDDIKEFIFLEDSLEHSKPFGIRHGKAYYRLVLKDGQVSIKRRFQRAVKFLPADIFTGGVDWSNNPIYENDIVANSWECCGIVKFDTEDCCFYVEIDGVFYQISDRNNFEVVGDMHTTPYLISDAPEEKEE